MDDLPKAARRLPADFWRLWTAATVSGVGDGVRFAALPLLAAGLTRDPRAVALVSAAEGLPWLLFALPAGALVDRWDRKRVLWIADLCRAGVAAGLALAVAGDAAGIPLLAAAGFLLGVGETLADTGAQAALPAVVPAEQLEPANGRLYAGMVVAGIFVGPPLGGVLFVAAAALPFGFDAATFLVAALLALRLRADLSMPADQVASRRALRAEIAEGLRWLWRHRELRLICGLLTFWNLAENALLAILVLYALEVLRLPEASYGLLLAGLAVGGVVGSLLAERVGRAVGTGRSLAGALWLTVLAYVGTGLTSNGVVAFLMLALDGAAAFVWNVLVVSFRQAIIPARLLGRVTSAFRFVSWGVIPIGAALGGLAAELLGLRAPFLLAAGLLALLGAVALPRLGNERLERARAAAQAG